MELTTIITLILFAYIIFIHYTATTCSKECYPNISTLKILGIFILGISIGYILLSKRNDKTI